MRFYISCDRGPGGRPDYGDWIFTDEAECVLAALREAADSAKNADCHISVGALEKDELDCTCAQYVLHGYRHEVHATELVLHPSAEAAIIRAVKAGEEL